MAFAQRPASRFFAAFYRWSRHTQRPRPCTLDLQRAHLSRRPATHAYSRPYHATCRLRAEDSQPATEPPTVVADSTQLKDDVRRLMRKVPASVAVITVAHVDPQTEEKVPMGIAVSSLSTVTLDPPTISFNIKQPSHALNAIRDAHGCFRVHFLGAQTASLKIIEHFCNGNHPDAYEQRLKNLPIDIPRTDHGLTATASLAPRILGNAVRAAAECSLTHEFTVGDHVILVAQVKSLETNDLKDPTIAYVDGAYRRLGSSKGILGRHQNQHDPKQTPAQQQDAAQATTPKLTGQKIQSVMSRPHELSIAYDWPVVPGDAQRHEYAERLKTYIRGMPELRFTSPRELIKYLQTETRHLSRVVGIDLVSLIHECQNGATRSDQRVLPEFYGHLSSAKKATLVGRMKQLVKTDRRFLEVGYIELLRYLDVHISATSILPSDLLNPLRAEGLLAPFGPLESLIKTEGPAQNVLIVEQAEHAMRTQLSTLTDREILRTSLAALIDLAKVPNQDAVHFRESLIRLKVETCKSFHTEWRHDIAGEVTPEEALVVIRRLVEYSGIYKQQVYQTRMLESTLTILRRIGVHPLTIGINASFILSKIRHLCSMTTDFSTMRSTVEESLHPYFARTVTWETLESRITNFVQKLPLRATSWTHTDALAAMGLSEHTTISTPLTETPRTIAESNLLDMLMATALKKHYGNGTDEENRAIARFLQDRYGFDVARRPAPVTPEEALMRSSADDLEAARLQHQVETLPIRDRGR